MRAKVELPTDDEDTVINRGIAHDLDNPERGADFFADARSASEVLPPELHAGLVRRRGTGKKPAKVILTLRVQPDVLEGLKASGPKWRKAVEAAIEKLAGR